MKISWNDFAQRRKINLDMFNTYTYEDYKEWCDVRSVDPVSKDSFDGVKTMLAKPIVEEVTTISTHRFDRKQLKKLRKTALVVLCKEQGVILSGDETKNNLIDLLIDVNNER
tara:strand:- start:155 stop:490 length:336 start_codon:yes stop_codon:yes gene_type:complete